MPKCSWCSTFLASLPRGTFCSKRCHEEWWEAFKADLENKALALHNDGQADA